MLGMNQGQPIGIDGSKRHVRPHVASSHYVGSQNEWDQNHANGIRDAPIERVKETWIGKHVMWLV